MKLLVGIVLLLFIFSCTQKNGNVQISSESFPLTDVTLEKWNHDLINTKQLDTIKFINVSEEVIFQLDSVSKIGKVTTKRELKKLNNIWQKAGEITFSSLSTSDSSLINNWFNLNLLFLQITGNIRYTKELEKLAYSTVSSVVDIDLLKQAVFTRMYDQLYVNLPCESSAHYNHTTGGTVHIAQEVSDMKNGHWNINFEVSDKRYVELFIFIPPCFGHALVTVGGVKYKAVSGEYCRVAKKWKTGDTVEITLDS